MAVFCPDGHEEIALAYLSLIECTLVFPEKRAGNRGQIFANNRSLFALAISTISCVQFWYQSFCNGDKYDQTVTTQQIFCCVEFSW